MSNMFKAHIFKRRSVGERQEVSIRMFNLDDTPFEGGSLLSVWKGDYDEDTEYKAGELVRYDDSTWLALSDAPVGSQAPGPQGVLEAVNVVRQSNGTTVPGFVLPFDTDVDLATVTKQPGYYLPGSNAFFRVEGDVGESITLTVVGTGGATGGLVLHPYKPDGSDLIGGSNYAAPQTWTIPTGGHFGLEVFGGVTSIKAVGSNGPRPVAFNPWTLFA